MLAYYVVGVISCCLREFESGVVDEHVGWLDLGIRHEAMIGSKPLLVECGFLRLMRQHVDDYIILGAITGRHRLTCKMLRSIFF